MKVDPKKSPIFLNEGKKNRARRIGSAKLKQRKNTNEEEHHYDTKAYERERECVCMRRKINKREQRDNLQTLQSLFCRPTNKMFTMKRWKVPWPKKVALQLDPLRKNAEQGESAKLTQRKNSTEREYWYSTEAWQRVCERERERKRERESGKSTNRKTRNNAKRDGARKTAREEYADDTEGGVSDSWDPAWDPVTIPGPGLD